MFRYSASLNLFFHWQSSRVSRTIRVLEANEQLIGKGFSWIDPYQTEILNIVDHVRAVLVEDPVFDELQNGFIRSDGEVSFFFRYCSAGTEGIGVSFQVTTEFITKLVSEVITAEVIAGIEIVSEVSAIIPSIVTIVSTFDLLCFGYNIFIGERLIQGIRVISQVFTGLQAIDQGNNDTTGFTEIRVTVKTGVLRSK